MLGTDGRGGRHQCRRFGRVCELTGPTVGLPCTQPWSHAWAYHAEAMDNDQQADRLRAAPAW